MYVLSSSRSRGGCLRQRPPREPSTLFVPYHVLRGRLRPAADLGFDLANAGGIARLSGRYHRLHDPRTRCHARGRRGADEPRSGTDRQPAVRNRRHGGGCLYQFAHAWLGYPLAMDWRLVVAAMLLQGAGLGTLLPALSKAAFDAMREIRDRITTSVRFNAVVETGVPGFIPRAPGS
jgi:hypothetical protein